MELQFTKLNVKDIEEDEFQPRTDFNDESITDLANSIKHQGLLQPIICRPKTDEKNEVIPGKYVIISGARRYKAVAYKLHRSEIEVGIPTTILEEKDRFIVQVQENLQREDLTEIDLRDSVKRMNSIYKMSNDAISKTLGKKSANFVSRILASFDPKLEPFLEMCSHSYETLSEIKRFKFEDRMRLREHFELTKIPYTGGKLRNIGLMRDAGIDIQRMDIPAILSMSADEVKATTKKYVPKAKVITSNRESLSLSPATAPAAKGKYADDNDDDSDLKNLDAAILNVYTSPDKNPSIAASISPSNLDLFAHAPVVSGWSSSTTSTTRSYENDSADDVSIGDVSLVAEALIQDQNLEFKIHLPISRLQDVAQILKDDLPQTIELPLNIRMSRVRELIAMFGGDPSIDIENLVPVLSRLIARGN